MNKESREIKFTNTDKSKRMGFFTRIKRSIFNVEKYGEFLLEKTKVSIKYMLLLILILTIILSGVATYDFTKIVSRAYDYAKNELPNFTYSNGIISFEKYAEGYDKELDLYNIIDSNPNITQEIVKKQVDKVSDYSYGIIFLVNEVILVENGQPTEIPYEELESLYGSTIANKSELMEILDSVGVAGTSATYFIALLLAMYVTNLITYLLDIFMVCVFGYLVSRIVGIPLNFGRTFALSIYSMTLSLILSTIYSVVYTFTGFEIQYFSVMYLVIAYIYIIAAILIIKSDLIKQQVELKKIYKVEAEVRKELEEQKDEEGDQEDEEEEDDKKEEKKKEKEEKEPLINREPDGSEI